MRNLGRKVNRKMDCGKEEHREGMLRAAGSRPLGRALCQESELIDYPSGFLSRQKATSPDKGRHWRAANPGDGGRCGGRGKIAGGRSMIAPTITRPYRYPELSYGCKKVPPPAGCHVRNRKCLTTPPAFCPDKKPPPLTRGGMGAVRTWGFRNTILRPGCRRHTSTGLFASCPR